MTESAASPETKPEPPGAPTPSTPPPRAWYFRACGFGCLGLLILATLASLWISLRWDWIASVNQQTDLQEMERAVRAAPVSDEEKQAAGAQFARLRRAAAEKRLLGNRAWAVLDLRYRQRMQDRRLSAEECRDFLRELDGFVRALEATAAPASATARPSGGDR